MIIALDEATQHAREEAEYHDRIGTCTGVEEIVPEVILTRIKSWDLRDKEMMIKDHALAIREHV